jgi:hypothetical protein
MDWRKPYARFVKTAFSTQSTDTYAQEVATTKVTLFTPSFMLSTTPIYTMLLPAARVCRWTVRDVKNNATVGAFSDI